MTMTARLAEADGGHRRIERLLFFLNFFFYCAINKRLFGFAGFHLLVTAKAREVCIHEAEFEKR
jgi:hypothetical protein